MSQMGQWLQGVDGSFLSTLTGNTGGQVGGDSANNINIVGTGGVTVTGDPGSNTLTIASSGGGGGVTWQVITIAVATMSSNTGYIVNYSGTCLLSLPSVSSVGDLLFITGINNATGWQIVQGSGQSINFSTISTTSGASGYLASSYTTDSIQMVCIAANTTWQVISSVGNITYN